MGYRLSASLGGRERRGVGHVMSRTLASTSDCLELGILVLSMGTGSVSLVLWELYFLFAGVSDGCTSQAVAFLSACTVLVCQTEPYFHLMKYFLSSFSCGAHCRCLHSPADRRTERSIGREQNPAQKVVYMHLQCPSAVSSPSCLLQGNSCDHFWCSGSSGILQERSQPYLYLDPSSSWVLSFSPGPHGQPCCLWFEGKVLIFPKPTEDSCNICWYLTKSYTEGVPHSSHCLCCSNRQCHSTLCSGLSGLRDSQ